MEKQSLDPRLSTNPSVFDTAIRLIILLFLIAWCIGIILPFAGPVLWGAIIAVSLHPLFVKLRSRTGNRDLLAGVFMTFVLLVLMILPCLWLLRSLFDGIQTLATQLKDHTLAIPPPNESVSDWPVIGKRVHDTWLLASQNLESVLTTYREPLADLGMKLLNSLVGFGTSLLLFFFSLIIAGIFLVKAQPSGEFGRKLVIRLVGGRAEEIVGITSQTIKQVAKGILGVAFLQFILAGVVLMLADVPLAGVWALAVLMLAIIQLPTALVFIPVIIYLFSVKEVLPAAAWAVPLVLVSLSDNVLKPLLMGKGAPVPVLVIFLGAIGGFAFSGFIGLFTGAIILSVGYILLIEWIGHTNPPTIRKSASDLPD